MLSLDGMGGLRGWQWLFIVEGLPTILLGFWINRCLAPNPLQATFLKQEEAEWLHKRQQLAKVCKSHQACSKTQHICLSKRDPLSRHS